MERQERGREVGYLTPRPPSPKGEGGVNLNDLWNFAAQSAPGVRVAERMASSPSP